MDRKNSKFPIFAALLITSMVPSGAQEAVDPYKKTEVAAATSHKSEERQQVSLHLDTFSLPINEAFALLREFPTDRGRYDQLVKLAGEGKAKIERMIVLRTQSGQRAVIESSHELRYPTQFTVTDPVPPSSLKDGATAPPRSVYPSSFETRNVGDSFEVEPVINAENTIVDINLVPQTVHYLGDRDIANHSGFQQPLFETQKTTTSVRTHAGQPFLLGTPNPPFGTGLGKDQTEQRIWFQFITAYVVDAQGNNSAAPGRTTAPASRP